MAKAIRAALGIAAVLAAFAPAFGRPPRCPDNIIVQFYGDDERAALAEKYQCAITHTCRAGDFHRVGIPAGHAPEIMVEPELNYYADIFAEPNDTYYSFQWHMQNDTTGGIYIEDAWAIETGDPNVIVAVVDTGVAYEDFDRFRQAPDLAGTSFVPGYDFINDDETTSIPTTTRATAPTSPAPSARAPTTASASPAWPSDVPSCRSRRSMPTAWATTSPSPVDSSGPPTTAPRSST